MTIAFDTSANLGQYKLLQRSQVNQQNQIGARSPEAGVAKPTRAASANAAIAEVTKVNRIDSPSRPGPASPQSFIDRLGKISGNQTRLQASEEAARIAPRGAEGAGDVRAVSNGVTTSDLEALVTIFGSKAGDENFDEAYDYDGDGAIGPNDLFALLSQLDVNPGGGDSAEPTTTTGYSQSDLDALRAAFGSRAGDEGFSEASDLNGDGKIDPDDLFEMLARMNTGQGGGEPMTAQQVLEAIVSGFGSASGDAAFNAQADVTGDGRIGVDDLFQQLAALNGE